jgi:hypothetical protein
MFDIQVLLGSSVFGAIGLVHIFIFIVMTALFWSIMIYFFSKDKISLKSFKFPTTYFILGLLFMVFVAPSMVITPRVTISTQENQNLNRYQENRDEVIIVTPPPRVEFLEGFRPLRSD